MGFLAGDDITAARLNRLQPKQYWAQASTTLPANNTSADIPGVTVTFTTEQPNAIYTAHLVADFDWDVATATLSSARIKVDGAFPINLFAVAQMPSSTERATNGQTYRGVLGSAGSHTITAVGTTSANNFINVYSSLLVVVYEVV
ncbi:hypothetical protein MBT84_19985 [Streptomyces sp. MBT84]|uniref:hypothetical protein n=1 Tax=Streptomyces sp. MBT84 TaxID=1488414 RepID=UPI001C6ED4E9|nr:hypothetical protein [Streptomyces sp. MBT84]MBW8701891.1 hypothetical protein [Streptomyces sp. MBT84]